MLKDNNKRKRKRGDVLLGILDAFGRGILEAADIFEAFLAAGYGASYGKMEYELSRIKSDREKISEKLFEERKARLNFQKLFSALKRDDLIVETKERREKGRDFFRITKRGLGKLKVLRQYRQKISPPIASYVSQKIPTVTIVSFDVPEKMRSKRDWLRAVLKRLGFQFIQKSIFVGKIKMPVELIEDLRELGLIDFVEIFQVTKSGSLRHVE